MSRSGPVGVGFIGTGMISDTYLENLTSFPDVEVLILGDLDQERAKSQAEKWGVPQAGSTEDVLNHPDVELVINLTIPAVHAEIASRAIAAGKHVWTEKPISVNRSGGRALIDQAAAAGLLVGVAPDTVLGPGVQTARRAIARGDIGVPMSAQTTMQYIGPDIFHPNPDFLFAVGAGPLFDIGPYYLTTLVHVFGPVARVAAFGSQSRAERSVQVGDRAGQTFPVEVPTQVSAIAQFEGGGVSQSIFSFDSHLTRAGLVEIAGTEGTLVIPDPNMFDGEVRVIRAGGDPEGELIPSSGVVAGRGIGALDMARAIRSGRAPLASGDLGYHVIDIMVSIDEAVKSGQSVDVASTVGEIPLVADDNDPFAATL